jgi:prolyl-tRNA editing enzyme YbaK/EbsC (Cys-tRNA(Pro) deacylase)
MAEAEERVRRLLEEKGIAYEATAHEPVYTSEQAARVRGLPSAAAGIKSMILRSDTGGFLLVLNPGDQRINTKKIARLEGVKDLTLATAGEVETLGGVTVGCVPPFGLRVSLKTYLNRDLLDNEFLYFNPGSHTLTFRVRPADLMRVLEAPVLF